MFYFGRTFQMELDYMKLINYWTSMKTIKNIQIKVTYTVGYGNLVVPDNVYDALVEFHENNGGMVPDPGIFRVIWLEL